MMVGILSAVPTFVFNGLELQANIDNGDFLMHISQYEFMCFAAETRIDAMKALPTVLKAMHCILYLGIHCTMYTKSQYTVGSQSLGLYMFVFQSSQQYY